MTMKHTGNLTITDQNLETCLVLAQVTGALSVQAKGAQFPALGRVIAMSTWGLVLLNNGMFCAGCRGPWTREQALAHWGKRTDERAKLFTAAIRKLGEDA